MTSTFGCGPAIIVRIYDSKEPSVQNQRGDIQSHYILQLIGEAVKCGDYIFS